MSRNTDCLMWASVTCTHGRGLVIDTRRGHKVTVQTPEKGAHRHHIADLLHIQPVIDAQDTEGVA